MQLFADLYDGLTGFPRPTIAACHGACVGGGAEIAVSCDLRVGGSNMRMRFPGAGLGVPVGPARLVTLCGLSVAKYLLLTSKEIAVDEAFRWGIVHKVAPAPRTEEAALQLADADRRAPARVGQPDQVDAARLGRRRGSLPRRGRGPGRVAVARARAWATGPEAADPVALRSLLEIAHGDAAFAALAAEVAAAAARRRARPRRSRRACARSCSLPSPRPSPGSPGRPVLCVAADDRGARDLAAELGAYLAPRRVRYYPSRGTGYESHLAPPPHLVGLRIAALDALVGDGRRRAAGRRRQRRRARRGGSRTPRSGPAGFALTKGEEIDLGDVAELLAGCGYERVEQVEDRGQFAVRGGILDVFGSTEDQAARIELFGDEIESIRWFSTFTQRSLGEAERIELDPAAEIDPDHRLLAEEALADAEGEGAERPLAELLPTDRFGAFLDLIDDRTAIVIAAPEELDAALDDHLTDVRAAIHDEDVAKLYVGRARPAPRPRGALS